MSAQRPFLGSGVISQDLMCQDLLGSTALQGSFPAPSHLSSQPPGSDITSRRTEEEADTHRLSHWLRSWSVGVEGPGLKSMSPSAAFLSIGV